jgi:linoleate 8R-lipoxygenase/9,12-octadecadienoate 8-hydroperoxide 8R-isomerase
MYMLEAARIQSSVALPRKVRKDVTVRDGAETHYLKEGDVLVVNLVACSHDPKKFSHPDTVDTTRPESDYIFYGWGPHQCLGMQASKIALTTMLRTVARLRGLRRAPGAPGQLKSMRTPEGFAQYLMADGSQIFPFPTTMRLRWDGNLPHRIEDDEEEEL